KLFQLRLNNSGLCQFSENPADGRQTPVGKIPVIAAQSWVAVQQVFQIPVEETVAPKAVKHRLEVEGHVFEGDRSVFRNIQVVIHQLFIFLEDLINNVGLVPEVVIQIAGRYRQ